MLPLRFGEASLQATQKRQECGGMLYNELEQEHSLSGVRLRLATIAYVDILLCSIGPPHKIRQTPVIIRRYGGDQFYGHWTAAPSLSTRCFMQRERL